MKFTKFGLALSASSSPRIAKIHSSRIIFTSKLCFFLLALAICHRAEAQFFSLKKLSPLVVESDKEDKKSVLRSSFASNASVIDSKAISLSGASSVADLLVSKGGVRLSSLSGQTTNGSIHLRGFGENSASRVLILIDGRPANRPDIGAVSLFEVPISRVHKIEILRGSQSARFGDNAVGGVINLITKSGKTTPNVLESAAGSDGTMFARASYSLTEEGHRFGLDLEKNQTAGWRENSASDLVSSSIRWDKTFTPWIAADFTAAYAEEEYELPGGLRKADYLARPKKSKYTTAGHEEHFSEQTRWNTDATILLGGESDLRIEIPISFQQRDALRNFGSWSSYADNLFETYQLKPILKWTHEKTTAQVGIDAIRDTLDVTQFKEIQRKNQSADADLTRDRISVHASGDWEVNQGWFVNAAARWESSSLDAHAIHADFPSNPNLNFQREGNAKNHAFQLGNRFEISETHSVWLRYDRLYRLPSTDEVSSYQGFALSVPFNTNLQAETGDNLELGTEWTPGNATFGLNAFFQRLNGEILYDGVKNLNVNFADTRRLGSELHLAYFMEDWNADVRYTALQAKFANGQYEDQHVHLVPNHEVSATLSYSPLERLTFLSEYQFLGNSFEIGDTSNTQEKIPAYQLVSLMARYHLKPSLMVYARVNNLFDEHYALSKSYGDWYPGAGRQYLIGLRCEF